MASRVKSVSSKQQLAPAFQIQRHGSERRAIVKCFFIFTNCKFVKFCLFQKIPKILQFMEPGPKKAQDNLPWLKISRTVSVSVRKKRREKLR